MLVLGQSAVVCEFSFTYFLLRVSVRFHWTQNSSLWPCHAMGGGDNSERVPTITGSLPGTSSVGMGWAPTALAWKESPPWKHSQHLCSLGVQQWALGRGTAAPPSPYWHSLQFPAIIWELSRFGLEQSGFFHNWEVVSNKSCVGSFVCSCAEASFWSLARWQVLGSEQQIRASLEEKVGFISHCCWNGEGLCQDLFVGERIFSFPSFAGAKFTALLPHPTASLLPRCPLRVPYVACHRNISLIFLIHIKTSAWLSWECDGVCGMRKTSRFETHALTWRPEVKANSRFPRRSPASLL